VRRAGRTASVRHPRRRQLGHLERLAGRRFTDLDANLAHFEAVYRSIIAAREDADPFGALWGDRYRRLRRRYLAPIESELREVREMRAALGSGAAPD
jgi:hypothetical protein